MHILISFKLVFWLIGHYLKMSCGMTMIYIANNTYILDLFTYLLKE